MQGRKPPKPPVNLVVFPTAQRPIPAEPDYLSAAEKRVWEETARVMVQKATYDEDCAHALAAYCVQWTRFREANAEVQKRGLMIRSKRGGGRHNPFLGIQNSAFDQWLKIARQLGLTPASRRTAVKVRAHGAAPAARFLRADTTDAPA